MIRSAGIFGGCASCVPRECGDDPQGIAVLDEKTAVLPANAGMIRRRSRSGGVTGCAPGECGDDPGPSSPPAGCSGAPRECGDDPMEGAITANPEGEITPARWRGPARPPQPTHGPQSYTATVDERRQTTITRPRSGGRPRSPTCRSRSQPGWPDWPFWPARDPARRRRRCGRRRVSSPMSRAGLSPRRKREPRPGLSTGPRLPYPSAADCYG